MRTIQRIALALVIIGALNWGLIGFFKFDLVASLFGGQEAFLSRVVYGLVGLSGLACLGILFNPMEETVADKETNRRGVNNLSYDTEFGEETDIAKLRESSRKPIDEKNSADTRKQDSPNNKN